MTASRSRLTPFLLALATAALLAAPAALAEEPDGAKEAPAGEVAKKKEWIVKTVEIVRTGQPDARRGAIKELIAKDDRGDCLEPLCALLPEAQDEELQLELIRSLGRDGLFAAAEPIEAFLGSKNSELRANAAVSLEYIGEPGSAKAILKKIKKEKDEGVQNHMARALGRCGNQDTGARSALLKLAVGGKSEFEGLGAIIGLAYFEGDTKAARGVEKLMSKFGPPTFGRKSGRGQGSMQRMLLGWTLAHVGDKKSEEYVEKRMLGPLENAQSRWAGPSQEFYMNVIRVLRGSKDAMNSVEGSVKWVMARSTGADLYDAARKNRDNSVFTPKADWEIQRERQRD